MSDVLRELGNMNRALKDERWFRPDLFNKAIRDVELIEKLNIWLDNEFLYEEEQKGLEGSYNYFNALKKVKRLLNEVK